MKSKFTLALAASIFALTLAAYPRSAAASTTAIAATSDIKGGSTDDKHKDWSDVILAIASSLLL